MKKTLLALSIVGMVSVAEAQIPRMTLFEEFTGENCAPCAATNPNLDALLAQPTNTAKCIALKWQVPIPSAPSATWSLYRTNESEIRWRYLSTGYGYQSANTSTTTPVNGINSAPSGKLDGQFPWQFGAASSHPANLTSAAISNAAAVTTPFGITITPMYDATITSATVNVTIMAASAITTTNSIFRLCLTERTINFPTAPGTNGEKDFHDVVIKSYPTTTSGTVTTGMGTAINNTWAANQTQTLSIICPIPSYVRDLSQLAFVGFIQEDANKKVWQAARSSQPTIANDIKYNSIAISAISCTNSFAPVLNVKNNGSNSITSLTITPYIDGAVQTTYTTAVNIAGGASVNVNMPTYTSTNGSHTFSVNISGVSGGDINVANNKGSQNFVLVTSYAPGPLTETFTANSTLPANWFIVNPTGGTSYFTNNATVGFNGAGSAKYDFYNSPVGKIEDLYIKPLSLSSISNSSLTFDVAYARYDATTNDQIEVKTSVDCGATWTTIYAKTGTVLATAPNQTGAFSPSAAQWRNEVVALPANTNNSGSVLIKFVATSDYGNNAYIDNVNVINNTPTSIKSNNTLISSVELYPNPSTDKTNLIINSTKSMNATINVVNLIGQVVLVKDVTVAEGTNNFTINTKELSEGVYNIVFKADNTITKKLTVTK